MKRSWDIHWLYRHKSRQGCQHSSIAFLFTIPLFLISYSQYYLSYYLSQPLQIALISIYSLVTLYNTLYYRACRTYRGFCVLFFTSLFQPSWFSRRLSSVASGSFIPFCSRYPLLFCTVCFFLTFSWYSIIPLALHTIVFNKLFGFYFSYNVVFRNNYYSEIFLVTSLDFPWHPIILQHSR